MTTNTPWAKVETSMETKKYLRGTHEVWSRIADNEHIFTVRPIGETPGPNDGGYYDIAAALTAKGLKP